jgi:hypothetical protein
MTNVTFNNRKFNHPSSIFNHHLIIFIGLFLLSFYPQQNSLPEGLYSAIRAGNAKELSTWFNANIELNILDKEGVYSKLQAEQILKEFFYKNVPSRFVKNHEGGKDESKYGIGTLNTSTGQYRISFFMMKTGNGVYLIHKFIIEDDNN